MKNTLETNSMRAQIIFANDLYEDEVFHQEDLVQLFPFGMSMTTDASRPMLLLKDKSYQYTLPVALSPIEAGLALSQNNKAQVASTSHRFSEILMQSLNIEIKQAVFVEIRGANQYVRLHLSGHAGMSSVKLRADEVMSMCLHLEVPLYATKAYIGRSRVMCAEIESSSQKNISIDFVMDKAGYLN